MSDAIVVALVTAGPPTLVALGTLVAQRRNRAKTEQVLEQVTPSNGTPTAAIVEALKAELEAHRHESRTRYEGFAADLRSVKDDIQYHVTVQHGRGPTGDEEVAHG